MRANIMHISMTTTGHAMTFGIKATITGREKADE